MPSTIRKIPLASATHHHAHDFHQIVITLCGSSEFEIEGLGGRVNAFSGCIVPANHEHYYSGHGHNRQLIIDLPENAPALTGEHRELVALFDVPRFFASDNPLRHYLAFMESELAKGLIPLLSRFSKTAWPPRYWARSKRALGIPHRLLCAELMSLLSTALLTATWPMSCGLLTWPGLPASVKPTFQSASVIRQDFRPGNTLSADDFTRLGS